MKGLLEQLEEYASSDHYPFHMPGHKRNMPDGIGLLKETASLDITEIDGFDDLHQPTGILKDAEERAAAVFGAEETFYLVNGSTAGILISLSAAVDMGSRVLMARNCHRSVYHALYLRRLQPIFLYPGTVEGWGIADAILPEQVEEALRAYPDTAAVILTSPTYDGVLSDVEKIAAIVHGRGIPLIVDGAHGAHLGFAPGWPESPVRQGADLVIQSLHKTLPSLTQTALLHVNGNRVDRERIRMFERIYQTSSPSYVLMASMDACVGLMEEHGGKIMEDFSVLLRDFHAGLAGLRQIMLSGEDILKKGRMKDHDRGKLLIAAKEGRIRGSFLQEEFLGRYHLQMEMAGDSCVTAILTPWDSREGLRRLSDALWDMDGRIARGQIPGDAWITQKRGEDGRQDTEKGIPYPALAARIPLYEALEASGTTCPLAEASGRTAGDYVDLYPPGIPLAVPGEVLTEEVAMMMDRYGKQGMNVQGLIKKQDGEFHIRVL